MSTLAGERPWGALVAAYFVLVGLPGGLGLMGFWAAGRGPAGTVLERHTMRLSLAALVAVIILLVADLGRPSGFFLMLTRFDNLASPIAFGAKIIAVKTGLLAIAVYATQTRWRLRSGGRPTVGVAPALRWALLATSIALAVYPAAVLSRTWSSPAAATPFAALLFALTALLMGTGTAAILSVVLPTQLGETQPVFRRLLAFLLLAYTVTLGLAWLGLSGDPHADAIRQDLSSGGNAVTWWLLGGAVGIVLPGLLLAARGRIALGAAAIASAAGAGAVRFLLFAIGG